MELLDWIDLLSSEPRLQSQNWRIVPAGRVWPDIPADSIRNERDQCPLCAWAELQNGSHYESGWLMALREVFGMDTDLGDAPLLADGADIPLSHSRLAYPEAFFARQLLLELFNLQEPV